MTDLHCFPAARVTVPCPCPRCGFIQAISVPKDGFARWKDGELIQTALPSLTADEREALMTGLCPKCWDEMFPEED